MYVHTLLENKWEILMNSKLNSFSSSTYSSTVEWNFCLRELHAFSCLRLKSLLQSMLLNTFSLHFHRLYRDSTYFPSTQLDLQIVLNTYNISRVTILCVDQSKNCFIYFISFFYYIMLATRPNFTRISLKFSDFLYSNMHILYT